MMRSLPIYPGRFLAVVLLFALVLPSLAGDREDTRRIVVIDDDGHEQTITMHDGQLELVMTSDAGSEVHAFDMEALAPVFDEALTTAMAGLEEALVAWQEADIDIRVEDDMLTIEQGDRVQAVNVKMLAHTIDEALSGVFAGLEHPRGWHEVAEDDLDAEMTSLRAEVEALQEELILLREELAGRR